MTLHQPTEAQVDLHYRSHHSHLHLQEDCTTPISQKLETLFGNDVLLCSYLKTSATALHHREIGTLCIFF